MPTPFFFMSDHHNDRTPPPPTTSLPPPSSAFERFRQAVLSVTGLDADENPERHAQRELKTRQRNEEIRLECERVKTDLLATSAYTSFLFTTATLLKSHCAGPLLVFIQKHLNLSGNPVPASNIQCGTCGTARAGGFSPDLGGVFLCSDQMFSKSHMETTIAHELLHMYDHTTFKMDWSNLRHHACSEVFIHFLVLLRGWLVDGKCR